MEAITYKYIITIVVVMVGWYIGSRLLLKIVHKFFSKTNFLDEKKEQTIQSVMKSILNGLGIIIVLIYILQPFVDLNKLLAGAGIVGIVVGFSAQSILKDFLTGIFRISTKQIHKGDFVKINDSYTGTVEEVGLLFLQIREWSGKLLSIPNGSVKEVQNYNMQRMRVIEKVTTSFYEDPEKVYTSLEEACERLNETYDDYLLKDEHGNPLEKFQIYGMSSLNENNHGYSYTVVALVKDNVYWNASKFARKEIATSMYRNKVKMAEENKYYRTKSSM